MKKDKPCLQCKYCKQYKKCEYYDPRTLGQWIDDTHRQIHQNSTETEKTLNFIEKKFAHLRKK